MQSMKEKRSLSEQLPGIVIGGGVFNTQMNEDPDKLPIPQLIAKAFKAGVNAIDTSPYYGPSEILIGKALEDPAIKDHFPRESYILATKVGRIALNEFNYSASWVRESVQRSLSRLHTQYLDQVYCHDVEFVTDEEVLEAFGELIKLQNEGIVHYIGISGYPPHILTRHIENIKQKFGRAPDMIQNYSHFNLQNTELVKYIDEWKRQGVECIINSSPLSMGLLAGRPVAAFHPSPPGLRKRSMEITRWLESKGLKMSEVALKFVISKWALLGDRNGGGVNISGLSFLEELDEVLRVFQELRVRPKGTLDPNVVVGPQWKVSVAKLVEYEPLFEEIQQKFGEWKDYSWDSPPAGFKRVGSV